MSILLIDKYIPLLLHMISIHMSAQKTSTTESKFNRNAAYLENVECGSYMDYVATDIPDHYRYSPFYVRLARCHGANTLVNPRNRQCVPTRSGVQNREIYVFNMGEKKWKVIGVQNHTECEEMCTLDRSMCTEHQDFLDDECACSCRYEDTPKNNPCTKPFYWDKSMCDCICSIENKVCEKRKIFSSEECGCVCKQKFHVRCSKRKQVIDDDTCECVEPSDVVANRSTDGFKCAGYISSLTLTLLLVMEFIVIIVLYFIVYGYCYKRVYFKCKADKKAESITNYPTNERKSEVSYSITNGANSTSTMEKQYPIFDDEVPPYTLNDVQKNSLNRNSLNRNSLKRGAVNSNSLLRNGSATNSLRNSLLRGGVETNSLLRNGALDTNSLLRKGLDTGSLLRGGLDTNSLLRGGLGTNSLQRGSLPRNATTSTPIYYAKASNEFDDDLTDDTEKFYPVEERSPHRFLAPTAPDSTDGNFPCDNGMDENIYNDIEPVGVVKYSEDEYAGDYEGDNYKNISLV